jgi:phage tail sheath gpL-like
MASAMYVKGIEAFMSGDIDLLSDTIKVVLVDSAAGAGYTPNMAMDDFLADIPADCRIATSDALASKTVTGGVFDAADIVFSAVAAGDPCEYLVIYKDTGSAATSQLIALIDDATGLPVTPNGADITVTWDDGANKIFKIG